MRTGRIVDLACACLRAELHAIRANHQHRQRAAAHSGTVETSQSDGTIGPVTTIAGTSHGPRHHQHRQHALRNPP